MVKGAKYTNEKMRGTTTVVNTYVNSANKCIHKISPPTHTIIFLQMKTKKTRLSNCRGQSNLIYLTVIATESPEKLTDVELD